MKYGYARVSTDDQDLTVQQQALTAYGCDKVLGEKYTGTKRDGREKLETILEFIREGDLLVVTKLDRLARDLFDLQTICRELESKCAGLVIIDQHVDTSTAAGKAFFQMLGVFAEFEHGIRRERQLAGIARAKAEGKYKGKKRKLPVSTIKNRRSFGEPVIELAKDYGVSRQAIYDVLAA